MDECQKIDLAFEDDDLIDNKQFPENSIGARGLSTEKNVDKSVVGNENDNMPELHESTEPGKDKKDGKYNLRKSLAWDKAFFINEGVLDAEELTTMITGADKRGKCLLPGIQEEMTESTESLSSLESDALAMGNLEDDLFVDIRASIQRSSKRALDSKILIGKMAAMEIDSTDISSLEKEDTVTKNKNPKSGLKKPSSLPTVGMSKCQPKQNTGKLGSEKAIKPSPDHSKMSVVKVGENKKVLPKPSNTTISRSIPSTTAGKRESVGTSRVKSASGVSSLATLSVKGTQPKPTKVSSLGGPKRGTLPKSGLSSSTTTSVRSSTSSDSSSNTSSRTNPGKSNLLMPRRTIGKSANVGNTPIHKTPSGATPKNKVPSSTSTLSAYMASNKIISPSVSLASSISEWSSASSSSSSGSMKGDITQNADDSHGIQTVGSISNNLRKSSAQTGGSLQAPVKPSGLRMPSHKFGFFDGGKSNNLKNAKAPIARMATSPMPAYPESFQEKPHTLGYDSIASKDVIKSPILSVKGGGASVEIRQEAEKVENGANKVVANTGDGKEKDLEKENGYDKGVYHKVKGSIEEDLVGEAVCRAPLALKNSFTSDVQEFVTQIEDK